MSSWTQKSPRAVNGTFPPRSSQKNPITAVFGDQQDYSVSKEKQSGPICCPSAAGVTSCNKSLISPPHLYLLRYIPHYYFEFLSFCLFSCPVFFFYLFFKKFSFSSLPVCYSTRDLWVAHMRRERLSFASLLKTEKRPCGWW